MTPNRPSVVAFLRAAGWAESRIAAALGVKVTELRARCGEDLRNATDRVEAALMQALADKAMAGDFRSSEAIRAMIAAEKARSAPVKPKKEPVAGKKAQARAEAERVFREGDWGDLIAGKAPH